MNLGRGFSVPQEKQILQNGKFWIPATPEKPLTQRPNYAQHESQPDFIESENWQDLLGIYSEVLQDVPCDQPPQELNLNCQVGPSHREQNSIQDAVPLAAYSTLSQNFNPTGLVEQNHTESSFRGATPIEAYKRLPQNFYQTGVSVPNCSEQNIQDVGPEGQFRNLNKNAENAGSYVQNSGNVVPPLRVNSLADLMGVKRSSVHFPRSCGEPSRSSYVTENSTTICPQSQVENNQSTYRSGSGTLHSNLMLHGDRNRGDYNRHQIPKFRPSVPQQSRYNLNLPATSEAGEFSSAAMAFQLVPVTPDHRKQTADYQNIQGPQFHIDGSPSKETNTQGDGIMSQKPQVLEEQHNKSVQDGFSVSSVANAKSPKGGNNLDGVNQVGIDLNKTPQTKTPKRRKHRPKVVVEGKPKRTPKPAVTKNNTPNGNSTGKRKYVRRNGIKTSTTPSNDEAHHVESATKSCRRPLNFDLENGVEKESVNREVVFQAQINEGAKVPFDLNLDFQSAEWRTEINESSTSVVEQGYPSIEAKERQHRVELNSRTQSVKQSSSQESLSLTAQPPAAKNHTLNVLARSLSVRNANIKQTGTFDKINHQFGGGLAQIVIQANTNEPNLDGRRQSMNQAKPQLMENLVNVNQKQGSKRDYSRTELAQPQCVPLVGSHLWSNGVSEMGHYTSCNRNIWQGSEIIKKSRVENKYCATLSGLTSGITTPGECSGLTESPWNKSLYAQSSTLLLNGELPNSYSKGKCPSSNSEAENVTSDWYFNAADFWHALQQNNALSQVHQRAEKMAEETSHCLIRAQHYNSITTDAYCNQVSAIQRNTKFTQGHEILNSAVFIPVERQSAGQKSLNKVYTSDKVPQQETNNSRGYGHASKKVKVSKGKKKILFSVDDITDRLKDLDINKEYVGGEQNALVPYGGDGAIVAFDPIKRRRPRPKVDLDPESNRLWNLLMGKEGSEREDTMDTDKQKWWEEERKVFRGRVDSFIARMHLVQGDRRFSRWKGSVVDSVVGVFLTQNVSDHLSSSAFMSLAARFPLKSTKRQSFCQNGGSSSGEQHEVHVTYPDGTTSWEQGVTREPVCVYSSVTSSEPSEFRADNGMMGTRTGIINDHCRREEDIFSSQSSSESFVLQTFEDIRSSSGSNSEADDQLNGRNFNINLGLEEQAEQVAPTQQQQFQVMGRSFANKRNLIGHQQLVKPVHGQYPDISNGKNVHSYPSSSNGSIFQSPAVPSTRFSSNMSLGLENWEADFLAFSGKQCMSSLASMDFGITNGVGVELGRDKAGQSTESSSTVQQTGIPKSQSSTMHSGFLNEHLGQQTDSLESQRRNGQDSINFWQERMKEAFQRESTVLADPTRPAEASSKQPSGNFQKYTGQSFGNQENVIADDIRKQSENVTLESNEMRKGHASTGTSSKMATPTSNVRKRKEKEKVEPIDWDTLRKQAQAKNGVRGLSANAMDSLDYEALRNADVREISDAIKERGMNNMLAERIKDFLNRLVRDHGRIDLEWLRDVQPDKAKDYLLSVRGLGLKSVECVRLLTLHHLAFPVDTNVGRIAVRLGWVPLQPLPESLQLHLLEMYPVLESIQKYLWPRLCKLDQETLYELHYQMITFGKVFCTKREPNCNACPMRGECRHFASAFASARLSLPGPEEKRVVCSETLPNAKRSSDVIINPVPLLPAGDNLEGETQFTKNSEPIIEEPTTPEAPTEVSERDIEDAFYEDPDEIPVIKLNLDEFTSNLQNFMQGHMEMKEVDMSRALVALSPGLASIPTPKLKHVSRLRTEHQVYELPDSHLLLEGLDRREPDDPTPYLLAIWTPGETADSVQPPESKCISQVEGGFCNNNTCFSCNSARESQTQTVRGTILIPCRTAMRGSFPLNGTYFQVNEVFADHESSINPIDVPRSLIWNLPRRTVFFGTSVSTIFKGLTTEGIQYCFWKGFVCVRGFDRENRAPRPLRARLHFPTSKMTKQNEQRKSNVGEKA